MMHNVMWVVKVGIFQGVFFSSTENVVSGLSNSNLSVTVRILHRNGLGVDSGRAD